MITAGKLKTNLLKIYEENGISHYLSCPRNSKQNGFVERINWFLQETAKTMINENNVAEGFWEEVVNTTCYIQNSIYYKPILKKISYELWIGRKLNILYSNQFGYICNVLKTKKTP